MWISCRSGSDPLLWIIPASSPITTPPPPGGCRRLLPLSAPSLSGLLSIRSGMLGLLAAGSVFFPGLFLLSKESLKHLVGWSEGDATLLATRLVSSLQAIMASSAGWIIASSCRDVMEDRHWLTESYILFATPYFAYDVFAMFLCYWYKLQVKGHEEAGPDGSSVRAAVLGFLRREVLMVLHHVFMVAFCFPASLLWRRGRGDYFQAVLFLAELSTPSVCLGKVLIQYQKQNSVLHKVNGVFMLLSFFSCRVLLFPYLYYAYSRYASIPLYQVPLVAPWQCNLGATLLWPLQLYWFSLICRGALKRSGWRLKEDESISSRTGGGR